MQSRFPFVTESVYNYYLQAYLGLDWKIILDLWFYFSAFHVLRVWCDGVVDKAADLPVHQGGTSNK